MKKIISMLREMVRKSRIRFLPRSHILLVARDVARREPELSLLDALCKPASVSVDAGSLWGEYALALSRSSKHCYAFEPNPEQQRFLKRAFRRCNITLMPCALSDSNASATLRVPTDIKGHATIDGQNVFDGGREVQTYRTETRSFDSCGIDDVGLVKIDVEGHELSVLRGMRDCLVRSKPVLIVEIEDRFSHGDGKAIFSMLLEAGYHAFYWHNDALRQIMDYRDDGALAVFSGKPKRASNYIFVHDADLHRIAKRLCVVS